MVPAPAPATPKPDTRRILSAPNFDLAGGAAKRATGPPRSEEVRFAEMRGARGLPAARIGVVDGDTLDVRGRFTVPLAEPAEAHHGVVEGPLA
ncbi:hypothetical protein ACWEQL_13100 [Kitasatospora sp. NPDC004240]